MLNKWQAGEEAQADEDLLVKDTNGNFLADGDTITVIVSYGAK